MSLTRYTRPTDLFDLLDHWERSFFPVTRPNFSSVLPSMKVDMKETENSFVVSADVPGADRENIKVEVENDVLTIFAERKNSSEEHEGNYHFSERSYGSFSRSVRLPKHVNEDKISATYENGVLYVTLPKDTQKNRKSITIN